MSLPLPLSGSASIGMMRADARGGALENRMRLPLARRAEAAVRSCTWCAGLEEQAKGEFDVPG
ncbi:MAG: hypothetical protein ACN6QT_04405 [Burkholderia contaminans]|jgi:hypothetical protein|uniref:Uncharacterized protein n=1 Tax=Burkholderia contaminans TaxID=488447 RepID=A0AAP4R0F6_9BURK|nr:MULTISPECIES: hypothetical protein [Burkholderia]MBD1409562.1 hypothetical protein [Burkholderia contaminans]MBH9668537.1 hypothetical protein [Burkholderia contaminans]MBH9675181.1 hypothetical protein [Burkholderia contaminans]MBH9705604.1 hypothetical protein [Burkholderia contaminans]MBM6425307.1 hypothetical protein [Burkholderia contaminans]